MRTDHTTARKENPMPTADGTGPTDETPHYKTPDWFTRQVFNRLVHGSVLRGA